MTSVASARRSTGTLISDALGAAVSAAICAGDLIWRAAAQPPAASSTTPTKPALTIRALPVNLIGPTPVSRDHDAAARNLPQAR